TALAHLLGFFDDLRRVQQCLGRNTPDIQTNATEIGPALDERNLHPQIRGAERGGVATGPGAKHEKLRAPPGRRRSAHGTASVNAFGSASIVARKLVKRAPAAPSITR